MTQSLLTEKYFSIGKCFAALTVVLNPNTQLLHGHSCYNHEEAHVIPPVGLGPPPTFGCRGPSASGCGT